MMVASGRPHTPLPRLRQLLLGDHAPATLLGQMDGVVCLLTRGAMENWVGGASMGTQGTLVGTWENRKH